MATNNNIKDQVLLLFPDNNNSEITAANMRMYVEAIFAESEVVINKIDTLGNLAFNNSTIYEGSLVVIHNDIPSNIGIYVSRVNQPTNPSQLVQISTIVGGGTAATSEKGGLVYNPSNQYFIGDIASYDDGQGLAGYICTNATSGAFISTDWQEIGSGLEVIPISGTLDRDFGRLAVGTDVTGLTPTEIIEQGYTGDIISSVSIVSPDNITLEKGDTRVNVEISSDIILGTGALTLLEYMVNNTVVNIVDTPSAGINSFEVSSVTDTSSFSVRVTDTIGVNTSDTRTYTYVYPYYSGVDAPGVSNVVNLDKDVRVSASNVSKIFTSNNNVFYFCYPQVYGVLNSILDENGLETISDWSLRSESIVGLDGITQTYNFYEFSNLTTTTVQFTFKR